MPESSNQRRQMSRAARKQPRRQQQRSQVAQANSILFCAPRAQKRFGDMEFVRDQRDGGAAQFGMIGRQIDRAELGMFGGAVMSQRAVDASYQPLDIRALRGLALDALGDR